MSIRDQYRQAFAAIRDSYGEEGSGWEIDSNVSLKQAIGYTGQYVVGHERQHFRYDYYHDVMCRVMRDLRYDPVNRKILCMDLGCGPGLFSWVVQDYMVSRSVRKGDIEIIGYDHAENMVRLSKKFHDCFRRGRAARYDWHGSFKIGRLKRVLGSRDFSGHDIIVTLGHVLIQVKDNAHALRDFSGIIRSLSPFGSCIVVAADAYFSHDRRRAFRDSCAILWYALREAGMNVKPRQLSDARSCMCARLDTRGG